MVDRDSGNGQFSRSYRINRNSFGEIHKDNSSLEEWKKAAAERTAFVNHTISELGKLVLEDTALFGEYKNRIKQALNKERNQLKNVLQDLISGLFLEEAQIKTALCSVNHREPVSVVFVSAPPHGLEPRT